MFSKILKKDLKEKQHEGYNKSPFVRCYYTQELFPEDINIQ